MAAPAFVLDLVGSCLHANPRARALLPHVLEGGDRSVLDWFPGSGAAAFRAAVEAFETGRKTHVVFEGSLAPLPGSFAMEFIRVPEAVVVVLRPSPEGVPRAPSEDERFASLADAMPQLVWTAFPDGSVDYYNGRREEYEGLRQDEEGQWKWGAVVHPDDREATVEAWKAANESGAGVYEMIHRLKRASGAYEWHVSRAHAARDASGRVVRWYGTATNVQDLQGALVRAQEARADAERATHFAQVFVGMLGHDLRNPLSAIKTGAQLLRRQLEEEKHRRTATRIEASASRMAEMIDQLLDFTRIRLGSGLQITPTTLALEPLVRQIVDEVQSAHGHVRFEVSARGNLEGHWDGDRLAQVFSNLLANAAHHGEPDPAPQVWLEGLEAEGVTLRVWNAGQIPPEVVRELFAPFRGSLQAGRRGLGLGLFISREVVSRHGGTLEARSEAGQGTTFTLRLPRSPRAPREGGLG